MPSSAATLAALRPLLLHNSSASFLYSSVYLALLRAGLLNCVFMWASFRVLTLCPLSVKSMQSQFDPDSQLSFALWHSPRTLQVSGPCCPYSDNVGIGTGTIAVIGS